MVDIRCQLILNDNGFMVSYIETWYFKNMMIQWASSMINVQSSSFGFLGVNWSCSCTICKWKTCRLKCGLCTFIDKQADLVKMWYQQNCIKLYWNYNHLDKVHFFASYFLHVLVETCSLLSIFSDTWIPLKQRSDLD